MKFKKIIAAALVAGLCFTSTVVPAKAEDITNKTGLEWFWYNEQYTNWTVDVKQSGETVDAVYGVTFTLTCEDMSAGLGGAVVVNAENEGHGWVMYDWGKEDVPTVFAPTGNTNEFTLTLLLDESPFVAGEAYSNFILKQWWGNAMAVTDIKLLDAEGKALGATEAPAEEVTEPVEETPAEEVTEPVEETPAEEVTEPAEEVTEPAEEVTEPAEEVTEPAEEVTEPAEEVTEPAEEVTEPAGEVTEPAEEVTEPAEETPSEDATHSTEEAPAETETGSETITVLPKTGLVSGAVFFVAGAAMMAGGALVAKKKED